MKLNEKQKKLQRRAQTYARQRVSPVALLDADQERAALTSAWIAGYAARLHDEVNILRKKRVRPW